MRSEYPELDELNT